MHPVLDRSGVTLIELMIALVIGGIVTGVIYQAMLGQTRFGQYQSAREEVQQNSRAATDLLASELRGIGAGPAILAADSTSLTVNMPRYWGVVCSEGSSWINVLFPTVLAEGPFGTSDVQANRPEKIAITPSGSTEWVFFDVVDETSADLNQPMAACTALAPNPALTLTSPSMARARRFALATPPGAVAGDAAYVYDEVTYSIGSTTVPGTWLLRNGQPLAGPIAGETGLRFRYFERDGDELTSYPLNPTERNDIRRIRIEVAVESGTGSRKQLDRKSVEVNLRNRNNN